MTHGIGKRAAEMKPKVENAHAPIKPLITTERCLLERERVRVAVWANDLLWIITIGISPARLSLKHAAAVRAERVCFGG